MPLIVPTPAGNRRHKVTIFAQQPTTPNELGSAVAPYAPTFTVNGQVRPIQATERAANAAITADVTHEIRMQYNTFTNNTCRLAAVGKMFEIDSITNVMEQNREFVILAHELSGATNG